MFLIKPDPTVERGTVRFEPSIIGPVEHECCPIHYRVDHTFLVNPADCVTLVQKPYPPERHAWAYTMSMGKDGTLYLTAR